MAAGFSSRSRAFQAWAICATRRCGVSKFTVQVGATLRTYCSRSFAEARRPKRMASSISGAERRAAGADRAAGAAPNNTATANFAAIRMGDEKNIGRGARPVESAPGAALGGLVD